MPKTDARAAAAELEPPFHHRVGRVLRHLRLKLGRSIESVALEASINPSYLQDLEVGRRNPTVDVLNRVLRALGVSWKSAGALFDSLRVEDVPMHTRAPRRPKGG